MRTTLPAAIAGVTALVLSGCASDGKTASTTGPAGSTLAAAPTAAPKTPAIPSLVNVDLRDVLNDLSVRLHLDRANVPINIQLPIQLAVNVCGVSINVLAASTGGQAQCTATSAPQELAQVVQQQMAAGGSVGGGAQGGSTSATSSGTAASGTASGGSAGTGSTTNTTTNGATP